MACLAFSAFLGFYLVVWTSPYVVYLGAWLIAAIQRDFGNGEYPKWFVDYREKCRWRSDAESSRQRQQSGLRKGRYF